MSCGYQTGRPPQDQGFTNCNVSQRLTVCQLVGETADIRNLTVTNLTVTNGGGGCDVGLKSVCGVPPSLSGQIPVIQDNETSILANSGITISGPLSEDLNTPGTVTTSSLILPAVTSNTVTLQSTSTISTNTVYNLPSDGTAGYVLTTDGSGNLYWSSDVELPHFPDSNADPPSDAFQIFCFTDSTKIIEFNASAIATGNTRIFTAPDSDGILPAVVSGGSTILLGNTTYNVTGSQNTAIGYNAALSMAAGSSNVAVGYNALSTTTGSKCIGIGYNTTTAAVGDSNSIVIGPEVVGNGSNTLTIASNNSGMNSGSAFIQHRLTSIMGMNSAYFVPGTGEIVENNNTAFSPLGIATISNVSSVTSTTFTAAQVLGGIILRSNGFNGISDNFPDATSLLALLPNAVVGSCFTMVTSIVGTAFNGEINPGTGNTGYFGSAVYGTRNNITYLFMVNSLSPPGFNIFYNV